MAKENTRAFITDVVSEIKSRCEEAKSDLKSAPNDLFYSGRALAYQEMLEVIQSRLKIYDVTDNEDESAQK